MLHESFAATLALIGIVILVSSLLSGAVERTGLPQVAIFLALGAVLGPAGLGLLELTLRSPMLQTIATLGPALGALAGYVAITLLEQIRRRIGVRRDYESLYALGVAFTAYAAAEAVGGSGFLAAFAAGVVIALLDVELCDCFLDYGQATAEMFLLFTFVAFGAGLIWNGLAVADWRTVLFAMLALVMRTAVLLPALARERIGQRNARIIAWSGPRGLSSLLLVLLPVFAGVAGSEQLFAITSLVVLLSVAIHGTGIALFLRKSEALAPPPARPEPAAREVAHEARIPERITLDDLRQLQETGGPVILADVRTERSYAADNLRAVGSVRLPPEDAVRRARELGLDNHATVVLYCA